jgi:membrane-associated phospholipid phosphatase
MGRITGIILRQRPAEIITFVFLLFLFVLTVIFYSSLPEAKFLLGLYSVLVVTQIIIIRFKNNSRLMGLFYDIIFPVFCVMVIFDSLGWIVHYVNPKDIDPLLIRLDYLIFNNHPTVMLERIMNPLLTDIMQIAYTTYYFIPVCFGIVILKNHRKDEFNKTLYLILLCYYLSYLGYILFPALGPRFYLKDFQTSELKGFFIAEPVMNFLNRLEGIKRDAFPSGHTAVTVTVLYLAYRFDRKFFWIALPIVSALIFSTVYCRYHYVVDIIAGLALTVITVLIGEWSYAWWLRKRMISQK